MSDCWKNYDSKSTFDGYISKEKQLRSHAKIIAGILEKYGKPILDRVITPKVSIGDASRCALISMDSTLKSDLTVGPPIDFAVIKKDEIKIASLKCLNMNDPEFSKVCNQWSQGIFKIFDSFQRFDWE